jgi:hypothetical protein
MNDGHEMLVSPIQPNHTHADLIHHTSVFVWDEATMANKAVLGFVKDTCRQVMQNDLPFVIKYSFFLIPVCPFPYSAFFPP